MDAVEEIKNRLSIEDVVSEYVQLRPSGRNFKALSPFTNEKTPSLMVSPEKQIWHDFSSGKGGNMFSFVMEMEGLDFKGALEQLARKAGIDLAQYRGSQNISFEKEKKRLSAANEIAARFYEHFFSKNKLAQNYVFKTRGFSVSTAKQFRFGYAPAGPDALYSFLKSKGFKSRELKQAGLITINQRGTADMFRNRLMIPLCDSFGQVIGFTARQLEDEPNSPKYINTPSTLLYDKSRNVFGLHLAKESIRKDKFAVVVEGNLDVVASHQAGTKNVVATAGTALTSQHLKNIKRFSNDIRLAFDQDQAGINAMERSIPIASKTGVNLSIISIKGAKDPDELIQKDKTKWQEAISKPAYALDWLIKHYMGQMDIKSAVGKKQFRDVFLPIIKLLSDDIEKSHYINKISKILNVRPQDLGDVASEKSILRRAKVEKTDDLPDRTAVFEDRLLAILLHNPSINFDLKPLTKTMLKKDEAKEIFELIKSESTSDKEMKKFTDYARILELQFEELYQGTEPSELEFELQRLKTAITENFVKNSKTKIAHKLSSASKTESDKLLHEAKKLDEILSKL